MINKLLYVLIMIGGTIMMMGLLGGATEILSDDSPLMICAAGVFMMYLAIIASCATSLWGMDE